MIENVILNYFIDIMIIHVFGYKDGSWNPMVFANLSGQIFADSETCPCCFMCDYLIESILLDGQIWV